VRVPFRRKWLIGGGIFLAAALVLFSGLVCWKETRWGGSYDRQGDGQPLQQPCPDLTPKLIDNIHVVWMLPSGEAWTWSDSTGSARTQSELQETLRNHKTWIESGRKSGKPAMLASSDLRNAELDRVNLSRAFLEQTELDCAALGGADLSRADLLDASLENARLNGADLTEARLPFANLSHANLIGTRLAKSHMPNADLDGAIFEPESLPSNDEIASALSLEKLTYDQDPAKLIQLRKQLEDGGFSEQAKSITYALRHRQSELRSLAITLLAGSHFRDEMSGSWLVRLFLTRKRIDSVPKYFDQSLAVRSINHDRNIFGIYLEYLLDKWTGDWATRYGLDPGHALFVVGEIWALAAIVYWVAMHLHGRSGLYRRRTREGREKTKIVTTPIHYVVPKPRGRKKRLKYLWTLLLREWKLFRVAIFFSLTSAFNIGYKEFNIGQWLGMLKARENQVIAQGWVRTVAGFQSLASLFLFVMWLLSEFGRPFE